LGGNAVLKKPPDLLSNRLKRKLKSIVYERTVMTKHVGYHFARGEVDSFSLGRFDDQLFRTKDVFSFLISFLDSSLSVWKDSPKTVDWNDTLMKLRNCWTDLNDYIPSLKSNVLDPESYRVFLLSRLNLIFDCKDVLQNNDVLLEVAFVLVNGVWYGRRPMYCREYTVAFRPKLFKS
jgi:hypothetical protein